MRRSVITMLTFLTAIAIALPADAEAPEWRREATGWAAGPIEHTLSIPLDGTGAGGTIHEGYLYVSTWKAFSIYDVSDPQLPVLQSHVPLGVQLINEGPVTNGEILLLFDDITRTLHVWDVRDKDLPVKLSQLTLPAPDHIFTCLQDCAYAYGASGAIVDLRDPAAPRLASDWRTVAPIRVRHGMGKGPAGTVFTGSLPQYVLDVRNPEAPEVIAEIEPPTTMFSGSLGGGESMVSYVDWPQEGTARLALATLETPFSGACNESSGGLVLYDTEGYRDTGSFVTTDVFRITETGTPDQGLLPDNAIGCGPLGLATHPAWDEDGAVAVGWAEHGVRLFTIDEDGAISEAGGFMADGGSSFQPLWADAETIYSIDTVRGLDIFHVDVDELLPGKGKDKTGKHGDKHGCKHPEKDAC